MIGTGSSAIQSIPVIARQAKQLFVFQRTPYYSVPAHNKPLTDAELAAVKRDYDALRAKAGLSRNALVFRFPEKSAMELSEEERREEVVERGYEGFVLS